nr:carbon-nitrogen hydrolase family protein [Deinobacterium chartae]
MAAAQYEVSYLESWEAYAAKLAAWTAEAAGAGARLLVFPEYAPMELASLFAPEVQANVPAQFPLLQDLLPAYLELHRELARRHDVYLLAGSFPEELGGGRYVNRAYLFDPSGERRYQDKQIMTRFENEQWGILPNPGLKVFETDLGRVGVNICYDSEFPLLARAQVEAGAELILVPSCTDTLAGYHRVRTGSRARALENQCYVVQSPLVGTAAWSEAIDINVGAAGVYTPVDRGFPANGVLVEGELNAARWVYAEIDLDALAQAREDGQVFNHRDWPRQTAAVDAGVRLEAAPREQTVS